MNYFGLLSTITLGGTITIVVFVVIFSVFASVLLAFLTRRERRRFRASRVSMAVKLEPIEKLLKGELIKAKSYTKFAVTAIDLDNAAEIKSTVGAKFIKDLMEMIAGRAVRTYNYPISVAKYGNNRIVYVSKRLNDKRQIKQIEKILHVLEEPFVNPDGADVKAKCNLAVVNFPEAGREYSALLRSVEFGIADAIRKGGVSVASNLYGDAENLSRYLQVKRAIDKGELFTGFVPVVNVFNKERIGYFGKLLSSGETDYVSIMNESGNGEWLNKWLIDECFNALERIAVKSGSFVAPVITCEISGGIADYFKEKSDGKESYREQAIIALGATSIDTANAVINDKSGIQTCLIIDNALNIDGLAAIAGSLRPRYAYIDLSAVGMDSNDAVQQIASVLEPYATAVILGGVADKNGLELAASNGIDYASGSLFGGALTLSDVLDTL